MAPGLTDTLADEDLLGFEVPNHETNKYRLKEDLLLVDKLQALLLDIHVSRSKKVEIVYVVILRLSEWVRLLQKLRMKQTFQQRKFLRLSGGDWSNPNDIYAISNTQAIIYQVKLSVRETLHAIQNSCPSQHI